MKYIAVNRCAPGFCPYHDRHSEFCRHPKVWDYLPFPPDGGVFPTACPLDEVSE